MPMSGPHPFGESSQGAFRPEQVGPVGLTQGARGATPLEPQTQCTTYTVPASWGHWRAKARQVGTRQSAGKTKKMS